MVLGLVVSSFAVEFFITLMMALSSSRVKVVYVYAYLLLPIVLGGTAVVCQVASKRDCKKTGEPEIPLDDC